MHKFFYFFLVIQQGTLVVGQQQQQIIVTTESSRSLGKSIFLSNSDEMIQMEGKECKIVYNSNALGDDEGDFLLVTEVDSERDCCSILSSSPNYNVFVYCPKQDECFNMLNPEDNITANSCYLKYQDAVAQGNVPYVYKEGPDVDFVSGHIPFKTIGWSEEVRKAFLNLVQNVASDVAAKYIYQGIFKQNGQKMITVLEDVITNGDCMKVFNILQEIDDMIIDEAEGEKMRNAFSNSTSIIECVDYYTKKRTIEYEAVVAPQLECIRHIGCIFLLQRTKFVMNFNTLQCGISRTCFGGYEQKHICEMECIQ